MTESQQRQPTSELPSRREAMFVFLERAPAAPSPSKPQRLPILSGTAKTVSLLAIAIVGGAFVLTKSGTTFFERHEVSPTGQSEGAITRPLEYTEAERGKAFAAFRQTSGLQNKIDALLALAEAGDQEAMLEVSIALEELGRLSDAAAWDRRLSETGDINGVGRHAMKVVRGQIPGTVAADGAAVLGGSWDKQLEFIDGKYAYQPLDPRVAFDAGQLYSTGLGSTLGANPIRASEMLAIAVKADIKAADHHWAIHCAKYQSPYNRLACDEFVPTLLALSDDGSGEALFRQAEAYEEGWAGEANMTVAKLRYREARAVGHVGAATRLLELNEPVIRDDAGWTKILQKAVAGDVTAKRYIGLGCGQDTEISGPDYNCVLRMLAPLTDKTDPAALLEVCLAYEATGQSAKAASCEYQLAAGGSEDGKLLYAARLVTGDGVVPDTVRGLEIIATSSSYGLDPRTMFRIGDFYERAPVQLKEWGSNSYHAAYWYGEGKDHIRNGWVSWVRVCEDHNGEDSPGSGWCEGYEELRYEYKSIIRSAEVSSAYETAGRSAVTGHPATSPDRDIPYSVDHKGSRPSVSSATLPSIGKVSRVSDEELAILRRKWEIANSIEPGSVSYGDSPD